jgi:hypothetical protein
MVMVWFNVHRDGTMEKFRCRDRAVFYGRYDVVYRIKVIPKYKGGNR